MRSREVSGKAALSIRSARKFWHSLGIPNGEEDDAVFTEADLLALQSVAALVRDGVLDELTALGMTRAVARTTDRLAGWQVQLMAEAVGNLAREPGADGTSGALPATQVDPGLPEARPTPDPATARAAAMSLVDMADDLEPLLIYAWRRHLSAAITRMVTDAEPVENQPGVMRSVGFADLVSFTSLVRRLSELELARMVQRFEALASDVVAAHGGRVIKTFGDEVLFVAADAAPAAAVALDLVEAMAQDNVLPDVRVGMASGRVISRLGDVFGTTVKRASRLTAVAEPRTVLVDDAIASSLARTSGFEMSALRRRTLRGIGPVTPWVLRRAEQAGRREMTGNDGVGEECDGHINHDDIVDNDIADKDVANNDVTHNDVAANDSGDKAVANKAEETDTDG
jgi:adenylate cyclase